MPNRKVYRPSGTVPLSIHHQNRLLAVRQEEKDRRLQSMIDRWAKGNDLWSGLPLAIGGKVEE